MMRGAKAVPRNLNRRTIVSLALGLTILPLRPLWGWTRPDLLQLKQAVHIPLNLFTEDWQAQPFDAWVTSEEIVAKGASDSETYDRLFSGAVLRLPSHNLKSGSDAEHWLAYCTLCSHEVCEVSLLKDTSSVRLDAEPRPENPLLVCPCHFSVFDPMAQARVLAGPAPRGLYRFEFHLENEHLKVTHIEIAAMALFRS